VNDFAGHWVGPRVRKDLRDRWVGKTQAIPQ
jgi:hypothetical protein